LKITDASAFSALTSFTGERDGDLDCGDIEDIFVFNSLALKTSVLVTLLFLLLFKLFKK
jgi:hypothetical protein